MHFKGKNNFKMDLYSNSKTAISGEKSKYAI